VLTAEVEQTSNSNISSSRRNDHNGDVVVQDMAPMSFAQSILLDLLRRSNNDLQNYGGTTSLPLLFIALARVVIALLSLILSICGVVLHVLLAVTIRILFVVVDGFSLVQRSMWGVVERVVTGLAIRMDWQQQQNNQTFHHSRCNIDHNQCSTDDNTSASNKGEKQRRGGGGGTFGILEPYRKHILQQLALITSTTTTRTKLDGLPDIMNNTPPSLSLFALVTALAFIVHPDGLTWIVLGKICEGVWMGLQLLRGAATTIVVAALSAYSSSSSQQDNGSGEGGGSIGGETLSTIVASAVLASLIMLGKVMYRALYKKNTVTDTQSSSSTSTGTSSAASSSKKKKGRRGRNSGRHGNHHHNRAGQRNQKKDATADSTTSRTDSSFSLPTHPSKQQPSSRSPSPSCSTRTNSISSFVEEKETSDDAIPEPEVTADYDEASDREESKERNDVQEDNIECSNNGNEKSTAAQQLPHDPAHNILSKLRPDSTDSLSVPQLLDEDVSLGSSVAGSLVVDCGTKQGGGVSRSGGSNNITKKRGGARGKYQSGNLSNNGMVRAPPGFITKDSTLSSTKSATHPRNTAHTSRVYTGKNLSAHEKQKDDRKQNQPFSPKRNSDTNHEYYGMRTRASTSDCVIRHYDVDSSPHRNSNNSNITTGKMVSPAPSFLLSGQHLLQHEQRVRIASHNELSSPYRTSIQVAQEESSLPNNGTMRNNLKAPISPSVIRPPPGLGFGTPVEMNSFGHGGVGGVELAPINNHAMTGPTLSLSPPERIQPHPQAQQYPAYDQSNFLLQPSVFPSISNNHKMKESPTNEDDRIDADLQELGDQMVGSVLDF
jgi:hypothetical protein